MPASNEFGNDLAKLILNNSPIGNFGDATGLPGSATVGNIFLALHTADPSLAGNQSTNEVAYTSYARKAIPRTNAAITVSGKVGTIVDAQEFLANDSGSTIAITHFSLGTEVSGATRILASNALATPLSVGVGEIPRLAAGATVTIN